MNNNAKSSALLPAPQRVIWKDRSAMIKRGQRILEAHFRNRLEGDTLDIWFNRHLSRYAAFAWKRGSSSNIPLIQKRFWTDCEKRLYGNSLQHMSRKQ